MVKQTGKNVFKVCYKSSNGKFVVLGCFRNKEVASRSDLLQTYFREKYGKTGPSLAKCKSLKRRKIKNPGSKPRLPVNDLILKTISSDGLIITERLSFKSNKF